jgi:CheY-like chemotaxis protein
MAEMGLLDILIADDSADDQELLITAFRRIGVSRKINCVNGGYEAVDYIHGKGKYGDRQSYPYPSFVITDLKMQGGDGFTLLQLLKGIPRYRIVPTIVMSTSSDEDDIRQAYLLGASSYLVKPAHFHELVRVMRILVDLWLVVKIPAIDVTGRQLPTHSHGKLGQRLSQPDVSVEPGIGSTTS